MIFAAGLGTRLKPWTDAHPKALVPVNGEPVIHHVIMRLADAGVTRIIVNVHHYADQVVRYLYQNKMFGLNIVFSDERSLLLDTGGGIRQAARRHLIRDFDEPLLIHNADIYTDFDLRQLIDAHTGDVTLLTSQRSSSRQLYFDTDNRLCGWCNHNSGEVRPEGFVPDDRYSRCSFNGIQVMTPRKVLPLMRDCEPVFGIIPFYLSNLDALDIRGFEPEEPYGWFDVGRPETLAYAEAYAQK